jgi:hypothetical protein
MISSHHALPQVTAELISRINIPLRNILLVLDGKPLVAQKSGLRPLSFTPLDRCWTNQLKTRSTPSVVDA